MSFRGPALLLAAACTGDVELGKTDTGPGGLTSDCLAAQPFTAGLAAISTSGNTVRIAQATPTPPDVGDNRWTLEIVDGAGAPLPELDVEVRPWMPLHNHGLTPARYAAVEVGGGTYSVDTFDLIMPGTWEFTVELDAEGEGGDTAVFALCAEG